MSIRDFFQKKTVTATSSPAVSNSNDKIKEEAGSSGDFVEPEQKLRRSTKTLVKSKSTPKISEIDLTASSPKSSKVATPIKKVVASPKKSTKASPIKATAPTTKKRVIIEDEDFVVDDADNVKAFSQQEPPTAAASTPQAKKFNYREYMAKKNAVPVALGSKEIPEGAPNCFDGLAFLFTGDLTSMTRDQAQDIVKRYAGRVVSAPSKKTDYVVVGENPGPSKMDKVAALGLNTITEDGFLDLIRASMSNIKSETGMAEKKPDLSIAEKNPTKKKEQKKVESSNDSDQLQSDMWTVKYAPKSHSDLIGNPGIYEKLSQWLQSWSPTSGESKAALLSGPPGIGKTTMANLVCKEFGFDAIEMNASDTRNKKTLHETVKEIIDSTSLSGMFFKKSHVQSSKRHVLIMDEVDGMSAGDRGGMAELIQLIKKTRIPIICICNDRASPKVRSLANHCLDLRLRRPDARQCLPRIKQIAEREGLEIQPNAIEELVASTHADIRQILNLLSTYKLTQDTLSYDSSKHLSIGSAKDVEQGPFEATTNLLTSASSRMSINQRIDQYFIDSSLVPLMIHENYMKCKATAPREIISTGSKRPSFIELTAAAADALSYSDRVESMIRGSNQEWSLAPLHACMSCVIPAYYVGGAMGGRIDFAGWLGQNSRTGKNQRLLSEIAKHCFLHTRAGKLELRLDYISAFSHQLIGPMTSAGQDGIEKTISFLDDYSLSRDDVDSILDMVLDPNWNSQAFSKIPTTVRSAFTRKYNQGVHRLPYTLGGSSSAPVKRISSDVRTGEDGEEDEDAVMADEADDVESDSVDLSKDKMIKSKPAKKAPAAKKGKK